MAGLYNNWGTFLSYSTAVKACADISPLGGSVFLSRIILITCHPWNTEQGLANILLLPPKQHCVLHVVKFITNTTVFCRTQWMPERNQIFTHYQHVKTKQIPLGEGMMNMSKLDVPSVSGPTHLVCGVITTGWHIIQCGHRSAIC